MRHTHGMTKKSYKKGQDGSSVLALFVFLAALLTATAAPRAHAASNRHGLGFDIGQVLLMGDFSKDFSDSLGWGFTYSYEASDMFGLLAHFSYSSHSNND